MAKNNPYFSQADFAVFDNRLASNPEFDGERDRVRGKFLDLHKSIYPEIRRRKWDLHPHWMTQWLVSAWRISPATARIDFMTLRYSKDESLIKLMKKELFEDFGHFYANAMLAARVDSEGFSVELHVSEKAWVDGQNLKNRLQDGARPRNEFLKSLAELGGEHALALTQFLREQDRPIGYRQVLRAKASRLVNVGVLNSTLAKYKPGGQDLTLGVLYEPDDKRLAKDRIADEVLLRFEQLYPIYKFLSWSPQNDFRKLKHENKVAPR